jgi:hypothetical protein
LLGDQTRSALRDRHAIARAHSTASSTAFFYLAHLGPRVIAAMGHAAAAVIYLQGRIPQRWGWTSPRGPSIIRQPIPNLDFYLVPTTNRIHFITAVHRSPPWKTFLSRRYRRCRGQHCHDRRRRRGHRCPGGRYPLSLSIINSISWRTSPPYVFRPVIPILHVAAHACVTVKVIAAIRPDDGRERETLHDIIPKNTGQDSSSLAVANCRKTTRLMNAKNQGRFHNVHKHPLW